MWVFEFDNIHTKEKESYIQHATSNVVSSISVYLAHIFLEQVNTCSDEVFPQLSLADKVK